MSIREVKGLAEHVSKVNAQVARAIETWRKVNLYLKWVPCPTQFEQPEVRFQDDHHQTIRIMLRKWTVEAACMWVGELENLIKEESVLVKPTYLHANFLSWRFEAFDVDLFDIEGCVVRPTGKVRTYEEVELVCV